MASKKMGINEYCGFRDSKGEATTHRDYTIEFVGVTERQAKEIQDFFDKFDITEDIKKPRVIEDEPCKVKYDGPLTEGYLNKV